MEPSIYDQISTKIAELNALLDTANAQALSAKEVSGKQKLSAKMSVLFDTVLPTLQQKPTLYAERFDRKQLADWKNTYNNAPTITRDLETCIKKLEGLRISTGQLITAKMLRLYQLLSADVVDFPDLKPLFDEFVKLFKKGPRKKGAKKEDNKDTDTDTSDTTDTPTI